VSDYIERDAVTQMINKWADGYSYIEVPTEWAEDEVRKLPAADVVPVVRCRDCKWWVREGNDSYGYAMFCDHDCSLGGQGIKKPEDYCSYGERKGGSDGAADN